MALEDRIQQLRNDALAKGQAPVRDAYQGVTKARIVEVLTVIDRHNVDLVDAVFALLDDEHVSWFTKAGRAGIKFCEGASTAHIACHVGILQRGLRKLDREGRDYWLKPFWGLGAMEKVYFDSKAGAFIPGHPIAKSPNSAYRLADSFKQILTAPSGQWRSMLDEWIQDDRIRQRLALQGELAEASRQQVDTKHSDLIRASHQYYVPHFLPGYEVLYIDDGDGDRISEPEGGRVRGRSSNSLTISPTRPIWSASTIRTSASIITKASIPLRMTRPPWPGTACVSKPGNGVLMITHRRLTNFQQVSRPHAPCCDSRNDSWRAAFPKATSAKSGA
jgi:hypothetical protein